MVGSGVIITQRFGGIAAQEDRACVADLCHDFKGILRDDLKVFRGDGIGRINEIFHFLSDENISIVFNGLADDLCAGKFFYKSIDLLCDCLGDSPVGCEQDGAGHGIVLRLGKKVRRDIAGIGGLVRDHKDLTGACHRVDARDAEAGFLGQGNENIAGACDLVDAGDGLCAIGHGRDRLGAAHLVDLVRTGNIGCDDGAGCRFALCIGGCRDDDLSDARHFGRYHVHQDAGWIDRSSAGHIAAGDFDGSDLLAQDDPVFCRRDPALCDLLLMVGTDICSRPADHLDKFGGQFLISGFDLLPADPYGLFCQDTLVKLLFQFKYGLVAAGAYIVDDIAHGLFIFRIAGRAAAQQRFEGAGARVFRQIHYSHASHFILLHILDQTRQSRTLSIISRIRSVFICMET